MVNAMSEGQAEVMAEVRSEVIDAIIREIDKRIDASRWFLTHTTHSESMRWEARINELEDLKEWLEAI